MVAPRAYRLIVRSERADECAYAVSSVVVPKECHNHCGSVDSAYFWLRSNPAHWKPYADMQLVYTVTLLRYTMGERYPKCIGRIRINHNHSVKVDLTLRAIAGTKFD